MFLLDETVTSIVEHLSLKDALSAAATSSSWRIGSRADRVWIRLCRERWQFGATYGASGSAAPGERDDSSMEQWKAAVARRGDQSSSVGDQAFAFYTGRCKDDEEVRSLLRQMSGGPTLKVKKQVRREIIERGAAALDVLLVEERKNSDRQRIAKDIRQELSDRWAVRNWTQLLQSSKATSLEEGALVLSQWAKPDADVPHMRAHLERLAQRAAEIAAGQMDSEEVGASKSGPSARRRKEAEVMIKAVNQALFVEFGLQGNRDVYYDPNNSLLHHVLESRRGIPISLSIVWAAVACRCGLSCHLLAGFPAHLLIRIPVVVDTENGPAAQPAEHTDLYVDAFNAGNILEWRGVVEFAALLMRSSTPDEYVRGFVSILPPVQVYNRALRNLLNIYQQNEDMPSMLGVVCQMRALSDEENGSLSRAESMLSGQLGRDMITA
eukprot:TRINITY_DN2600_c0_g1_i1.p1 TRINITY_DN2600_c0_g1~~TRINITY_DN2600_c0_g1_i1.p1  ORF type:complete len:438 (-),score=55.07 TRINITY_DN2600_c0_g1_i1:151-1464(-)